MNLPDKGFLRFFASLFCPDRLKEAARTEGEARGLAKIAEAGVIEAALCSGE